MHRQPPARRPRCLAPTLLVFLLLGAALPEARAEDDKGVLVDEAYRLRIERPDDSWRLLDEAAMHEVVPDALAGMVGRGGQWCAVIGEHLPGVELEAVSRQVMEGMPVEGVRVEAFESTTFRGRAAVRFQISGRVNEISIRYVNTLFRNGDYLFQIICWAPLTAARPDFHKPCVEAVHILDGPITGRREQQAQADSEGIGWRVRDGVFESAALRIAVRPQGDWQVAVGDDLVNMNPDAEVGLVHAEPDVYMVLIAERAAGVDRAKFLEELLSNGVEEAGLEREDRTVAMKVAGQTVTLQAYRMTDAIGFDLLKGGFFHGDVCIQLVTWYSRDQRPTIAPLLKQAADAIELLTAAQAGSLAEELKLGPDPENKIGPGYVLRRGVYRDFRHGFTLAKPEGGFWRFLAGDEARTQNADACLAFEHPSLGVNGIVIAEDAGDMEPEAFHAAAIAGPLGGEGKIRTRTVDGAVVRITDGTIEDGGMVFGYRIASTVRHGLAYQFHYYGLRRNLEASHAAMDALLDGARFHGPRPEAGRVGSGWVDHRMGYVLTLPDDRRGMDQTPPAVRPIASMRHWSKGDETVFVLALCALRPGQDGAWFRNLFVSIMQNVLPGPTGQEAKIEAAELAGIEGERMAWAMGRGTSELFLIRRDKTFYALAVIHEEGFTPAQIAAWKARFTLIE